MTPSLAPTQEFLTGAVNFRVTLPGLFDVNVKTFSPCSDIKSSAPPPIFSNVPTPLTFSPVTVGSGAWPGNSNGLPPITLLIVLDTPAYKVNFLLTQIVGSFSG